MDAPEPYASISAPMAATTTEPEPTAPVAGPSSTTPSNVQVFQPVATGSTNAFAEEEASQEPTEAEIFASHAALIRKSKALNDRKFTMAKDREEEKVKTEKARMEKWPNTIIRIRFSDGTHIQSSFASTSKMGPVYQFVRDALADSVKNEPFTLYQPPNIAFPERPPPPVKPKIKTYPPKPPPAPKETLYELQLVPQSVLLVRFEKGDLNSGNAPAPLQPSLLAMATNLPPQTPTQGSASSSAGSDAKPGEKKSGEKKIPKWLQKGLMKK